VSWDKDLLQFAREIHSEVVDKATGGLEEGETADFKVNVFTQDMIDYLSESGAADGGEVCYLEKDLGGKFGILRANGYYLPEDGDRLDVFYTDYLGSDGDQITALSPSEVEQALKRCMRLFGFAQSGDFSSFEESSEAYGMLCAIRECGNRIRRLRVFLLTDKAAASQSRMQQAITAQLRRQQKAHPGALALRMELVDLTRIYRLSRQGAERDPVTVDMAELVPGGLPCIEAPRTNDAYACYLAALPGEILYELYEEYGQRLLQLNVRSFLQVSGSKSVNAKIRETLRTEPSMFLPYNNGISATAERVEIGRNADGTPVITAIQGIQIVNGGQTMASIHRAHKLDAADISAVYVQAKISVVTDKREIEFDELVGKISQYSNSQNRVNLADFSANDPFHVELDKLARETWVPGEQSQWFYERARGSYKVMRTRLASTPAKKRDFELKLPPSQVFSKTDMAKYLAAWDRLPHVVGKGGQKNFVEYMAVLKEGMPKKWKPDARFFRDLISKAIIYKAVEVIARQEGFPAYRANVVAYTVSLLSDRYGSSLSLPFIWSRQDISPALRQTAKNWTHSVFDQLTESAGQRNVTEWCKKEECWEGVKGLDVEVPTDLPEVSAVASVDFDAEDAPSGPSLEDLGMVSAVMEVDGGTWRQVAEWGGGSRDLTAAQVKLCHTLAKKSAANWETVPTLAQAKQAILILRSVKKRTGLLDAIA
jgi:hypothetical protein